jgi:hypothetical protein
MNTTDAYIEQLIAARILSPGARTMHPQDALDQYNEANGLEGGESGYLIHPDVVETTVTIDGRQHKGWGYRHNPHVSTTERPNLKLMQGIDRVSCELGATILGRI